MVIYLIGVAVNILFFAICLAIQDDYEAGHMVGSLIVSMGSWLTTIFLVGLVIGTNIKLRLKKMKIKKDSAKANEFFKTKMEQQK